MGNTVSAAEAVAAGITHHTPNKPALVPDHSKFDMNSGTPPPECPMHQKVAKPAASECPVINNDNSDINPYNMVFQTNLCSFLTEKKILIKILSCRCHQPIRIQHQINHFRFPQIDKCQRYQKQLKVIKKNSGYIQASKCSGMQCCVRDGNGKRTIWNNTTWTISLKFTMQTMNKPGKKCLNGKRYTQKSVAIQDWRVLVAKPRSSVQELEFAIGLGMLFTS